MGGPQAGDNPVSETEKAASRGKHDLVSGPIGRTLLLFSLPTLGSNILQSLNGSINSIWVGQFLGESALAATTNANLVNFFMFSVVFGFGMAASILIGQSAGRRDIDGVRRVIGTAAGFFCAAAFAVALLGWLLAPQILHVLLTPADVYPLALTYLRVVLLSLPPSFLLLLLMMGLRGMGDANTAFWFMGLSSVIDMGLNPVLILGLGPAPRMGIAGAGTATLIANYVSVLSLLCYIYAKDLPIRLRGREWRYLLPEPQYLKLVVTKGVMMGLQMIVLVSSGLAMIGFVNRAGSNVVAAYGAANQLWTYIQMPGMAVSSAVSAMAAQNIGAGRWDRVGRITRSGIFMSAALTGTLSVVLLLVDRPALGLFLGADSPALAVAQMVNRIAVWGFVAFAATMVLSGVVRANGVVVVPLVITAISLFPIRLGFAAALWPWLHVNAVWWSMLTGSTSALLLTAAYYRWGGWRKAHLLAPVDEIEVEEEALAGSDPAGRLQPSG
jgi:MATE family, multidrug efflux pump